MMLTASLVSAAFASPSSSVASGDDTHKKLHHAKNRLDRHIGNKHQDLDEISTRLLKAKERVDGAWSDLESAKATLDDLNEQVARAAAKDLQMRGLLQQAVIKLQDARSDVYQGTQDVLTQRSELASYAVSNYQSGGDVVMNIGVAFDAQSPQDALDSMQATSTVLDKQAVALQQFQATKVLLKLTEQRVAATKADVAVKRQDAADVLQTKITLKEEAKAAKQDVLDRLQNLRDAKVEIQDAKAREKERLHKLEKERQRVEHQLRKLAERRARQHARWLSHHRPTPPTFSSSGGGFLSYPVSNTYITSPYGMRMHPILHVYKLHDGTDFHADCGTPVYAAATGRVLAEYYNAGYGNRVILDHGFVKGVSLQTSYNHLTSFVARPGHLVQRGQLIAYSGTTGYSTGCHLHFMVYVNGNTVDPVNWL